MKVIKNVKINAFELGIDHELEKKYIEKGSLEKCGDVYKIYSLEAKKNGQIARAGDYVCIDLKGNIYPNDRNRFLKNYIFVGENLYQNIPTEYDAWTLGEEETEQLKSILERKKLIIHEEDYENYYEADLAWGKETADKDAVILFYNDKLGEECDFNFVAKEIFDVTYKILSKR